MPLDGLYLHRITLHDVLVHPIDQNTTSGSGYQRIPLLLSNLRIAPDPQKCLCQHTTSQHEPFDNPGIEIWTDGVGRIGVGGSGHYLANYSKCVEVTYVMAYYK